MLEFSKGKINKFEKIIHTSYNLLPVDPFQIASEKPFRFRCFSKVRRKNNKFVIIDDTNFFQNKKINHYVGGKKRKYKSIDKKVLKLFIKKFKSEFIKYIPFNNFEIGFHQIRIKCGLNFVGYPVPEGWHKDGFDYVVILNVASTNIVGGTTKIRKNLDFDHDAVSCQMASGDYLILNDHLFYHFTDPINVKNNNKEGFRDTLVITINKIK